MKSSDVDKAFAAVLESTGPNRWLENAAEMAVLLSAERWVDAREEYRAYLKMLRIDVRESVESRKANFARSGTLRTLPELVLLNIRPKWHLFVLRMIPLFWRAGLRINRAYIQHHAQAAFYDA